MVHIIRMRLVFILSLLVSIAGLRAQPVANVYLEPEVDAIVFSQVPVAKLDTLSPEHPVVDGEVDEDWLRVKYPGHYIGFVQTSELNDDGTFNPGARLFIRSATDSVVIARIQYGDLATVIDRGREWSTVDYRGEGTIYYRDPLKFPPSSAPTPSPIVAQAVRPTVSAPAAPSASGSSYAVTTIPVGPQEGGEILAFDESVKAAPRSTPPAASTPKAPAPQPITVTAPPPPPNTPQRPIAPAPGSVAQMPVNAPAAETETLRKDVPRLYEGTFTRVRGLDFNWFGPDYNYAIDGPNGKRIAYVNLKDALLFSSLESYFGKNVVVEGKPEKITGTVPIVIHAKFMRLK